MLSSINSLNKSMMLLNLIKNNQSGKSTLNISILLLLMESVRVSALLLITLMNKLTVKEWIKLNYLRLNYSSKERRVLFTSLKLIRVKAICEAFAILFEDGLTKFSRLLTISLVLMPLPLEPAAEAQLVTISFKQKLTS